MRINPQQRTGLAIVPAKEHPNAVKSGLIRMDKVSSRSLGKVPNNSIQALVRKFGIFAVYNLVHAKIQPKIRRKQSCGC